MCLGGVGSAILLAKLMPKLLDDESPRRRITSVQYNFMVGVLILISMVMMGSMITVILISVNEADATAATAVMVVLFISSFLSLIGLGNWLDRPETLNPKKLNPEKFE